MARRVDPSQPAPFDVSSSRAGIAWPKWRTFEYYLAASGVSADGQKRALLLHCAGPDVQELYETLVDEDEPKYETTMKALTTYFEPRKNVVFERHAFRQAVQSDGETVDEYCTRLRVLAASCAFGEHTDEHIRDQIVDKCTSSSLRRKLLRTDDLKLDDLLSIARATESADRQAGVMEASGRTSESACVIKGGPVRQPNRSDRQVKQPKTSESVNNHDNICGNCGILGHRPGDRGCPARNRECLVCKRVGHFARVCRSKLRSGSLSSRQAPINHVTNNEFAGIGDSANLGAKTSDDLIETFNSDDDVMFSVREEGNALRKRSIIVNNTKIDALVDSGSSVDIIDESTFCWMRGRCSPLRLTPSRTRLYAYGSRSPLPLLGQFIAKVSTASSSTTTRFVVVRGNSGCALSRKTSTELGLIRLAGGAQTQEQHVDKVDDHEPWTVVQRKRNKRRNVQRRNIRR
ncbi:uncharacterized protein LOC121411963 [Lytechinus variegatus]|uniref:uncharacterized protein LOC121411963 n=1 Tax=Lytechinus variegatus TaxID=7654 RepID=UPI001BB0F618|nr:uncharacterized protein LOC121411963 [Lytechinus variegatus]